MADLQTPATDVREIPRDRQPIYAELGYHPFQESEFAQGAGRCDKCGGGPDAEIHQKPIDQAEQLKRIADALELLVMDDSAQRTTVAVERIMDGLGSLVNMDSWREMRMRRNVFQRIWYWLIGEPL